MTQQILNQQ